MKFPGPFSDPTAAKIWRSDGIHEMTAIPKGTFAKVASVVNVAGGQYVRFTEQTATSGATDRIAGTGANATPRDADNAEIGFGIVPTAFGTVAVGDLVGLSELPARDERLCTPAKASSSIYSGVTAGAVASGASGNVTVSGVGTVSVFNQWSTTIATAKKCLIGWVANESRYQFIAVDC